MSPKRSLGLGAAVAAGLMLAAASPSHGQQREKVLRIAMTASDVPTSTGMPNNGFEGMRFMGYPIFEALVLWDLSQTETNAGLRPGLAESWAQDPEDPRTWIFRLRQGVTFHDGTPFNADAVIWNLDRYFRNDSPQFEPQASGISRARVTIMGGYRKIDDMTVAISSTRPASYFPYMIVYLLMTSPRSWEDAGRDWARAATLPPAGTGPFRLARVTPRQSAELVRNPGYWDRARIPKLDRIVLLPMPEPTTRMAALRAGQVDWIEVPPPDGIPALRQAGFNVVTGSYPHAWPWFFQLGGQTPFADVRVRQGLNWCVDREGLVKLLNGTAEPSVGWFNAKNPLFGSPQNRYRLDPARGRALLAEAGYGPQNPLRFKVMISTSGSGQMLPLPMNEFMQQSLREACGVEVTFEVTEWNTLLVATRSPPDSPALRGAVALNPSSPTSDVSVMVRYFTRAAFPPNGFNWPNWEDAEFEAAIRALEGATDQAAIDAATRRAHERLVDNPPWLFIVHDLNPRAMSRRVTGFRSAQSWFQDLVPVDIQ
jgi:peptide/nickel transport system substrate-binding protein